MFSAHNLRFEPQTILDHQSVHGQHVTGVRGTLIQGRLRYLRSEGLFDEYAARLPDLQRDLLLNSLAASWVPIEAAVAHYDVIDHLALSEAQLSRMAEPLGKTMFETLCAALLRVSLGTGAEIAVWTGLKQANRVWDRLYNGGGCKVVQVGPKDALVEAYGIPFASSRSFRTSHCGFLRGVVSMTAKACVVRGVPARDGRSDRFVVSLSWV